MRTIHPLPQEIITKIAAGEVIERPVYAIKELVENALDAKADYIIVKLEEAGLKKITIIDNGLGMSLEDIGECWKPHTTSKISEDYDLHAIQSFGFRGEALASIAAISDTTIMSRTKEQREGRAIEIKQGKYEKISPVGIPVGTHITIRNLFSNVPARKKFLKSIRTELRHCIDLVTSYALAYPNIRFFLSHDKRILLDILPLQKQQIIQAQGDPRRSSKSLSQMNNPTPDSAGRLPLVFGNISVSLFLPFTYQDSYITVSGYIAKPQLATTSAAKQLIFVNNRPITDKTIITAVKEAYGNLLDKRSNPLFILFITTPSQTIDINIHPRKEQVAFIDKRFVSDVVTKAVTTTLAENDITFRKSGNIEIMSPHKASMHSFAAQKLKEKFQETQTEMLETIVQLHNTYLVVQVKTGLLLIDQHAAHERILFETFKKIFEETKKQPFFQFNNPIILKLSPSDSLLLEEWQKELEQFGLSISIMDNNSIQIRTMPSLLKDHDPKQLLAELLDDLREEKGIKNLDSQMEKILAYLACRSAVKAGEKLTQQYMVELVKELEQTPHNATCPHARPTKISLSINELHKWFKRK